MLKRDYDVKVVCSQYTPNSSFALKDIELIPIKINRLWKKVWWRLYKKNIVYNFYNHVFSRRFNKIIKNFKPDLIHCHFGDNGLKLWDNLNKEIRNKLPIIIHFHGYDASLMLQTSKIYTRRIRSLLNKPNVTTILVSKNMLNCLLGFNIIPREYLILYYGIDLDFFLRKNRLSNQTTFLQVSSFRPKKGHKYSLLAFKKFLQFTKNASKYKLVFTGNGDLCDEIKEIANALKINNQVDFIGWVDHRSAKILMENADFFIHHSVTAENGDKEGIPNALIEAMAMELPIISTYHAGIPELVEDNVNGYLVNEKDIDAYANAMENILEWGYLTQNREKVEKLFSTKTHITNLRALYQQQLEN
jgi:glycosyltransferase involved in cell wall biosynthesis